MAGKRSEFVVLIPQKHLRGAKSRLSSVLTTRARQELVLRMLHHTLDVCQQLRDAAKIFVCGPEDVASLIREHQAVLLPGGREGMRRDVTHVACAADVAGHYAMLMVSSDLPMLAVEDLEVVIEAWRECADVVLCPDRRRRGTNVMMLNEPEHFGFAFGDVVGPGSFNMHLAQAQGTGLRVEVIERPGLQLDIDLPEDLARFIAVAPDHPLARFAKARFQEAFRFE